MMKKSGLLVAFIALLNVSFAQKNLFRDTLSLCNQPSLTLDVNSIYPSTTYTHLWSTGATTSSITVTAVGTYNVVATEMATGNQFGDTVEVISSAAPAITFATPMDTVYYWGPPKVIRTSSVFPVTMSYKWKIHTGTTTFNFFVAQPKVLGIGLHPLNVTVEDIYGCEDTTTHDVCVYQNFSICTTPTGIMNAASSDLDDHISIFPNPANDVINFQLNESERGNVQATVINHQGATVVEKTFRKEADLLKGQMDVSALPTGNYILHLLTPTGIATKSFLIQ